MKLLLICIVQLLVTQKGLQTSLYYLTLVPVSTSPVIAFNRS